MKASSMADRPGKSSDGLATGGRLVPEMLMMFRITSPQRTKIVLLGVALFKRVAASVPNGLAGRLEDLLVVKPDGNSSDLQAIKANPSKPSVDAMLTLLDKLRVIEATKTGGELKASRSTVLRIFIRGMKGLQGRGSKPPILQGPAPARRVL